MNENGISRLEHEAGLPELRQCAELLARVQSLPEAKDLIAAADALRTFMRKADLGYANQNAAANIAIKARRKAGEIARQIERNIGARTDRPGAASRTKLQEAAEEAGVSKRTLEEWQTLAASTTEADIDQAAAEATEEKRELTTADLMPRTRSPEWIAKLRRIEADAVHPASMAVATIDDARDSFAKLCEPEEVVRTLPDDLRPTIDLDPARSVVDWLGRFIRAWEQEGK